MFHTYVDWTTDGRPFYVGMGDDHRIHVMSQRNKRYGHVAKKHGLRREVVQSFEDRQAAVDLEIALINEYHTFVDDPLYNDIGCNYTRGGEGCPCSEETKQKMRDSIRAQYAAGREPWNKGKRVQYRKTEKSTEQRRNAIIAFNKSRPMLGKQHTEEALAKMRKPHVCSICKTPRHTKTTCPERPTDVVNRVAEAQQLRHDRERNQKFPGAT